MITDNLNIGDAAIEEHIRALETSKIADSSSQRFSFLYENLCILDSKASSLLTFNAVGLAALAIWLESIPRNFFHLTLDLAFLLFLISCGFCLKIVWIYWASTADLRDPNVLSSNLLRLRESRTMTYRWAWLLSTLAVAVTGLATIFHTFETAQKAFGF